MSRSIMKETSAKKISTRNDLVTDERPAIAGRFSYRDSFSGAFALNDKGIAMDTVLFGLLAIVGTGAPVAFFCQSLRIAHQKVLDDPDAATLQDPQVEGEKREQCEEKALSCEELPDDSVATIERAEERVPADADSCNADEACGIDGDEGVIDQEPFRGRVDPFELLRHGSRQAH